MNTSVLKRRWHRLVGIGVVPEDGRPPGEDRIVDDFHRLYYRAAKLAGWRNTHWLGIPIAKCPMDLWVYQEMIHEQRPDLIIETGTWCGGSALYLASVCDLVGKGSVVSIDVADGEEPRPTHSRIRYVRGSSVERGTYDRVRRMASEKRRVMVILDSDHRRDHVLEELRLYSELVTVGGYLIVEDTNLNGYPVLPRHGPGPMEAVRDFLRDNDAFVAAHEREKLYLTFNPGGFLQRLR